MITREIDVFDPAVVTSPRSPPGTTDNVIPETAEMLGTIRAAVGADPGRGQGRRCTGWSPTASPPRTAPTRRGRRSSTATRSRSTTDGRRRPVALDPLALLGPDRAVLEMPTRSWAPRTSPTCCSGCPGAMSFLGACPPGQDPATAPSNHSNRVVFDEDAMAVGVATHAAVALAALDAKVTAD